MYEQAYSYRRRDEIKFNKSKCNCPKSSTFLFWAADGIINASWRFLQISDTFYVYLIEPVHHTLFRQYHCRGERQNWYCNDSLTKILGMPSPSDYCPMIRQEEISADILTTVGIHKAYKYSLKWYLFVSIWLECYDIDAKRPLKWRGLYILVWSLVGHF